MAPVPDEMDEVLERIDDLDDALDDLMTSVEIEHSWNDVRYKIAKTAQHDLRLFREKLARHVVTEEPTQ